MSVASQVRRLLPARVQPAVRYHYERWRGLLERELPLFCDMVQAHDLVVDVGANVGIYTHALAKRGAAIEAFEPQPWCAEVLRAYASGNSHIRVHNIALGAADASVVLRVPIVDGRLQRGSASLVETDMTTPAETIDVDVRTLDSFGFDRVRAMKIDVEGAELGVLRGAAETIARGHPLLLVEIEQRHHAGSIDPVFAEIESMGYRGEFLLPDRGWRPLAEFRADVHQRVSALNGGLYINNFLFRGL
ncbi:MAG TPA: FkbM family methyltransferase [Gemmatimonadaceae bacterium]|jgi:FkbM family methyltransferase